MTKLDRLHELLKEAKHDEKILDGYYQDYYRRQVKARRKILSIESQINELRLKKQEKEANKSLKSVIGKLPNPGSKEAQELGCICPAMDNHYGRGSDWGPGTFIFVAGCPVHHRTQTVSQSVVKCGGKGD